MEKKKKEDRFDKKTLAASVKFPKSQARLQANRKLVEDKIKEVNDVETGYHQAFKIIELCGKVIVNFVFAQRHERTVMDGGMFGLFARVQDTCVMRGARPTFRGCH